MLKFGTIDLISKPRGRISRNLFCRQTKIKQILHIKPANISQEQVTRKLHSVVHHYGIRSLDVCMKRVNITATKPCDNQNNGRSGAAWATGTCEIRFSK